ncbi:MAG: coproporphyrinogen III oxidase family protein [Myxococcales bacterium]|nr:coproporphyrinogen III oxidase family protein [Myxococcales bacterium]
MYGVYVHVPWCRSRCPYCAFVVDTRRHRPDEAWRDRVLADWERERGHFVGSPTTLSFGGGTPSRADPAVLAAVARAVAPAGEVSLEANPEDVTPESVRAWRDLGVTRLSLGVQTFQGRLAPRLGRAHSSRQSLAALAFSQAAGFASTSVDLMFGLTGQRPEELAADLQVVFDHGVPHVSLYGLTIEPGTRYEADGHEVVDDDHWRALHDAAVETLEASGRRRYEVSNFARVGHRSVHNEHYWRGRRWAGLGPGAHGWRPSGIRVANTPDVEAWLAGRQAEEEQPSPEALFFELVWSTLRHIDGVDVERVRAVTGISVSVPGEYERAGLVRRCGGFLLLEPAGFVLVDGISTGIASASTKNRHGRGAN